VSRPNEFSETTKQAAIQRQKGRCAFCGIRLTTQWTLGPVQGEAHHLKPILYGGTSDLDNCVYLCWAEHKLLGHGMAPFGIDKQGGSSRTMIMMSRRDFRFWNG
jgi:predicted restriction endonuclease